MNYDYIPYLLLNTTAAIASSYAAKLSENKFLKIANKILCVANILIVGAMLGVTFVS